MDIWDINNILLTQGAKIDFLLSLLSKVYHMYCKVSESMKLYICIYLCNYSNKNIDHFQHPHWFPHVLYPLIACTPGSPKFWSLLNQFCQFWNFTETEIWVSYYFLVLEYYYFRNFVFPIYSCNTHLVPNMGKKLIILEIQRWIKNTLPSRNLDSGTKKSVVNEV